MSIAILDFCQVRVRRSLGRVSISFHTAPDSHFGKILVTPPSLSGGGGGNKDDVQGR